MNIKMIIGNGKYQERRQRERDYNWTKDPTVVTTMHWRADGSGEQDSGENHLYIVSSEGGAAAKISSGG